MDFIRKDIYNINDMREILRILRSDKGCPWDREQTHKSIRKDFIEEVYEAVEAIDTEDTVLLREELGDVLLQVIFHSCIEEENQRFTFDDVVNDICHKLVTRHSHVFGNVVAETSIEAVNNWNDEKKAKKGQTTYSETLESVSSALPALMRAQKIGQRAARAGMDFAGADEAVNRLESEISELKTSLAKDNITSVEDEIGDVLFSAVNVSRLCGIDSEEALTKSIIKFIDRFKKTEDLIRLDGIEMKSLNIDELDAYWQKAKKM